VWTARGSREREGGRGRGGEEEEIANGRPLGKENEVVKGGN